MRTTVPTALAALLAAAALTACSTTTAGTGAAGPAAPVTPARTSVAPPGPSASPTVASSPVPSPPATTTTPPAPASSHVPNELDAVLLTGAEIGHGFVAVADDTPPSPLPCTPSRPPIDDQVRNVEKGSAVFVDRAAGLQVGEEIYVYASTTEAIRHQRITETGLACRKGTMAGATIDIVGPTDVAKELTPRLSKAEAWSVANTSVDGSLVQIRLNAVVVQFAFVTAAGTDPEVDAKQVIETALAKIINHG